MPLRLQSRRSTQHAARPSGALIHQQREALVALRGVRPQVAQPDPLAELRLLLREQRRAPLAGRSRASRGGRRPALPRACLPPRPQRGRPCRTASHSGGGGPPARPTPCLHPPPLRPGWGRAPELDGGRAGAGLQLTHGPEDRAGGPRAPGAARARFMNHLEHAERRERVWHDVVEEPAIRLGQTTAET
jgi:hypothetical protein